MTRIFFILNFFWCLGPAALGTTGTSNVACFKSLEIRLVEHVRGLRIPGMAITGVGIRSAGSEIPDDSPSLLHEETLKELQRFFRNYESAPRKIISLTKNAKAALAELSRFRPRPSDMRWNGRSWEISPRALDPILSRLGDPLKEASDSFGDWYERQAPGILRLIDKLEMQTDKDEMFDRLLGLDEEFRSAHAHYAAVMRDLPPSFRIPFAFPYRTSPAPMR